MNASLISELNPALWPADERSSNCVREGKIGGERSTERGRRHRLPHSSAWLLAEQN